MAQILATLAVAYFVIQARGSATPEKFHKPAVQPSLMQKTLRSILMSNTSLNFMNDSGTNNTSQKLSFRAH